MANSHPCEDKEVTDYSAPSFSKVINDPIHGTIELHRYAELIMATPQFHRLRHLKQLGLTYLVYPSATHSRFEHSVGTYHLAWQLAKKLRRRNLECPQLPQLTENEVTCVALAGLCHDLGHGPYSHLWERLIQKDEKFKDYHHEDKSIELFDDIVDHVARSSRLYSKEFAEFMAEKYTGSSPTEHTHGQLIKKLIIGDLEDIPAEKQFLFEIINNKRTGFDVDKWDYINRDSYYLGLNNRFDYKRQLATLRALPCEGEEGNLLVIRDKQALEYVLLLVSRRINHYIGYQHIKVIGFEELLSDALRSGRAFLKSQKAADLPVNERAVKMLLEECDSVGTLSWLTDERLAMLLSEECGPDAQRLMKRLVERQSYTRLATMRLTLDSDDKEEIKKYKERVEAVKTVVHKWNSKCGQCRLDVCDPCAAYNTVAVLRPIDYGAGTSHPLSMVFSYSKDKEAGGNLRGTRLNREKQLFSDLLISSLHVTLVRLYERTPLSGLDEGKRAKAQREFTEALEECGLKPTSE